MHEHNKCNHIYGFGSPHDGEGALRHCVICDVIYCEICKKEWGQSMARWAWYPSATTIYSYPPVWSTASNVPVTHAHG